MTKVTKRDNLVAILGLVAGNADLEKFVTHEVELLDARKAKGRGETATQKENAVLKDAIVLALTGVDEGATATDVALVIDKTVQKATQLLKQLVDAGEVTRVDGKGKEKTRFIVG